MMAGLLAVPDVVVGSVVEFDDVLSNRY